MYLSNGERLVYNKPTEPSANRQIGTSTAESFGFFTSSLLLFSGFFVRRNEGKFLNSVMQYLRWSEFKSSAASKIVIVLQLTQQWVEKWLKYDKCLGYVHLRGYIYS